MDKIWLASYKAEVPPQIEVDNTTLIDMFEDACRRYVLNRAITCHKVSFTFHETRDYVLRLAQGLSDLGVSKGDRVAIILPNCLQYPMSIFAVLALGAVVVNINPLYTPDEMEYILQDSEPLVVICLDMFAEKLNGFYNKHGIKHIVVTKIADLYPMFKRVSFNLFLRYVSHINPKLNYEPQNWLELVEHDSHLAKYSEFGADQLAFIQYTGATTGRPKGAMLLHRNIVANIRQIYANLDPQLPHIDQQVVICALPLYHIFSLTANLFTFFLHGAENVMIPNAKDIKDLVKTMNNTPFTVFSGLDSLYNKLLEYKPFIDAKHTAFKYGICGGMTTRQSVADAWYRQTGLYPTNCYGLTETSPCVTMNYFDEPFDGSVGYPVPSTEIDIRDIKYGSKNLPQGAEGLIFVRGPQVMAGYWHSRDATCKALTEDGWFNTGDIGYFDAKGKLFISAREIEMIIVSGFNVYPAEVERVIDELKEIKEVAVLGVPDDHTGESVYAFIVFDKEHTLSENQILEHCHKELTEYKIPKKIIVLESLPKTLIGKIDKKAILADAELFIPETPKHKEEHVG